MNVIMLSYSLRLIFVLLFFISFLISTTTQCVRAPKAFSHYEYICVLFSLFQCIVVPICVCLLLLLLHVCVYARYTSIWMYARLCQWCEQHTLWHAQRQPHRPTDRPTDRQAGMTSDTLWRNHWTLSAVCIQCVWPCERWNRNWNGWTQYSWIGIYD